MKRKLLYPALGVVLMMTNCSQNKIVYPVTEKCDQQDSYFGTVVPDPYRWLENDTSAQTAAWVKAENDVTFAYLDKIPFREQMKTRLTSQWDYPKIGSPFKRNGRWMIFKNTGLQNQSVLYLLENHSDTVGSLLLDPNTFSTDGTVALNNVEVSKDGKVLIYGISRGGSDWSEVSFMDIDTRQPLADHLEWLKFSVCVPYKDGIIYSRFPKPLPGEELKGMNENSMVYFHKIGTTQDQDELLYSDPKNPNKQFFIYVDDDEQYFYLVTSESTSGNALAFKRIGDKDFTTIVDNCKNTIVPIDVINDCFYLLTDIDAPNYKVIKIDPNNVAKEAWRDIIPEKEYVLNSAMSMNDNIMASYLRDAHSVISFYDYEGNYLYDLDNDNIGSISGFDCKKEDTLTFYSFTSFSSPKVIYKYDIANNVSEEFLKSKINFDFDNYMTEQVFVKSKDGTEVPMFLTYMKGTKMNGKNPTLLYGYGGFNISMTPSFALSRIPLLENGGVLAVVNLRGGGEYGEEWHKAGTLMQKQNVFDDCIAAAEYLINNKYTSSDYLILQGGSNGGLLVGAVINQRPDLFAVALPAVGVMDMLRYHKFTIGKYWAVDYGTSEDSEEMFKYLYGYSPLHNIKPGVNYPAIMVTTADHDDRVVPAHSFKYAATLQDTYKGSNPVLIRIESNAGHGAGKPTEKAISEIIDEWAFAFYNIGFTPKY